MFAHSRRAYLIYSLCLLFLGLAFFFVSVAATFTSMHSDTSISDRRLYFDRDILPDHLFYPVLMFTDQVRLTLTQPPAKPLLQLEYAQTRLAAAKTLFVQGKTPLAFTTASKAHQYLLQANHAHSNSDSHQQQFLFDTVNQEFIDEYQNLKQYLPDSQVTTLDQWIGEILLLNPSLTNPRHNRPERPQP